MEIPEMLAKLRQNFIQHIQTVPWDFIARETFVLGLATPSNAQMTPGINIERAKTF
jgi:hypothetical protein